MRTTSRRDWGARGVVWAALFVVLALVYSGVVFLRPANFLVLGWDFQDHQLFLKTFFAESLRGGELPLWIPYICAGRPFAADPQAAVFYPPNLLYAVLSVRGATSLLVILHMAAAGYFAFLFCRELTLSRYASLLGGLTFMFNGFLVTRAYRGQLDPLMTIALTPLLFFLFERAERRGRWRGYLWAGMAGALQVLAGSPQFAWLTWLGLVVYVLCRRVCLWRERGVRGLGRSASGLAVALAFTAGLAAVQIVPAAELVGQSIRSDGSIEFAGAFAFEHQKIVHVLFPNYLLSPGIQYFNNLPEATGYIGLLGLVLAVVGLLGARNRMKWALLAVALVCAVIMLGRSTPLFGLLYGIVPGFSSFRIPSRAILMLAFCGSVLAGMGAQAMWDGPGQERCRKLGVAVAAAIGLAALQIGHQLSRFTGGDILAVRALWSGLVLAALALGGLVLAWRVPKSWVRLVWVGIVCVDLFFVGATMERYRELERRAHEPPATEAKIIEQMRGDPGVYRFALPRDLVRENCGVLAGRSGVNGFTPLSLRRYFRFVHTMAWQREPKTFTHEPDQRVFSADHRFPFKVLNVRYGVGRNARTGEPTWAAREDYPPRAFFASRWEVLDGEQAVLEAMRAPSFDPRSIVLFEAEPDVDFTSADGPEPGDVRIDEYGPDRITLSADVPRDGFLVLSEMDYPGWRAYVNGAEVPVLRADYLLRAVPLRAGRGQQIEFRFEPGSHTAGLLISGVSVTAWLIILIVVAMRQRGRPRPLQLGKRRREGAATGSPWLWRIQAAVLLAAGIGLPMLLRPHYAACWANIGQYFTDRGEYEEALDPLRKADRMAPRNFAVQFGVGNALLRQGKPGEAVEHLRRAVEVEPDSAAAQSDLGGALVRTGDLQGGLAHLRRAIELDPELTEAHYTWAYALARRGRFDEAAAQFDAALDSAPGDAALFRRVADGWAGYEQYARAICVLEEAVIRWPDSPEVLNALAWDLARCPRRELRDGARAVRLAERACLETARRNPRILLTLAMACFETGDRVRATSVAQEARSLVVSQGESVLLLEIDVFLQSLSGSDSRR